MDKPQVGIEDLFAPVSLSSFASEYWAQRPLYIEGSIDKVAKLFGATPTLESVLAIAERASTPPAAIYAFFQNAGAMKRVDATQDLPQMAAAPTQVRELLAAGATIAVVGVDAVDPVLGRWSGRIRSTLQHAGETACALWLSSPRIGMYTHFDAFSTLHVQLVGTKTWRLSRAAHVIAPPGAGVVRADGTADMDITGFEPRYEKIDRESFMRVSMRPGDLLFVPSGTWHETEADDGEPSVSCAFELRHTSAATLVASYLQDHFAADPRWRYLPLAPRDDEHAASAFAEFVHARIDEAIAALTRARSSSFALTNVWKRLIADNGVIKRRSTSSLRRAVTLEPHDVLVAPSGRPITSSFSEDGDGRQVLYLYQAGEVICFDDPQLFDFGRRLAQTETFVANEACGWNQAGEYPWQQIKELLEALVGSGILFRIDPAHSQRLLTAIPLSVSTK